MSDVTANRIIFEGSESFLQAIFRLSVEFTHNAPTLPDRQIYHNPDYSNINAEEYFSYSEVCEKWACTPTTMYKHFKRFNVPVMVIHGKKKAVHKQEVEKVKRLLDI